MSANPIYAKISGSTVVEYPVTAQQIQNRGEPLDWYVEVTFDAKPNIDTFYYAREIPKVVDGGVRVYYGVEAYTLDNVLKIINPNYATTLPGGPITPVDIANVDPSAITTIKALATKHIQEKLDAFAQEKGYDNLLAATSYKDSTVVQFSTEASIAIALRDQVWGGLYTFFDNVVAGTTPVPTSITDIEANLPAFTWP